MFAERHDQHIEVVVGRVGDVVAAAGRAQVGEERQVDQDVLLFLALAAALTYLRFDAGRRRSTYLVAAGLFVAALLSKTVTATLPALLKVIDRKQIDIVHMHGYGATTFGRALTRSRPR